MARPIASAIDPYREARTLHQTPSRVKAFLFMLFILSTIYIHPTALTSIVDWKKASRELLLARSEPDRGIVISVDERRQVVAISLWYGANWNMKLTGTTKRSASQ
jgi:hypothetical protein